MLDGRYLDILFQTCRNILLFHIRSGKIMFLLFVLPDKIHYRNIPLLKDITACILAFLFFILLEIFSFFFQNVPIHPYGGLFKCHSATTSASVQR